MFYEPHPGDDYEWVNCVHDPDYDVFHDFDGSPRAHDWRPIPVIRLAEDEGRAMIPSDFPWRSGSSLVMRRRAVEVLRDMLEAHGEILPLVTYDEVELHVLNVTTILDALDEDRAQFERFPDSDRIMWITRIAFKDPVIAGVDVFRLPRRGSPTYVSQRFVDRVVDAGLEGLVFEQVWPPSDRRPGRRASR